MKALLIYNPFSGYKKIQNKIKYIKSELAKKYEVVDVFFSESKEHMATKIINDALIYNTLIILGGDGTLNIAVNALMTLNKRPTLGYIPCGTANDIGKNLGLSKFRLNHSIDQILYGINKKMDLCKINDKYFLYAHAIGKYTDISYKANKKLKNAFGKAAYFIEALKHVNESFKMELSITANDITIDGRYYVLLTLNTQRIGGFNLYRSKKVKLNDGLIDLTIIKNHKTFSFINLVLFFLFGDRQKLGVKTITSNKFIIKSQEILSHNIDGEYAFDSSDVHIEVLKEELDIIVGKKSKKF